jgi:purine-binding chemotaxis protein CheW
VNAHSHFVLFGSAFIGSHKKVEIFMVLSSQYVVFTLDAQRYTLSLAHVERVIPAAYITPLPQAPAIIMGVINVQGHIIPVVNLRKRFRLAERELELTDQFIVGKTPRRTVALVVDTVLGVTDFPAHEITSGTHIVPGLGPIAGVIKTTDDVLLIHDLDSCLSLDEEHALDGALLAN